MAESDNARIRRYACGRRIRLGEKSGDVAGRHGNIKARALTFAVKRFGEGMADMPEHLRLRFIVRDRGIGDQAMLKRLGQHGFDASAQA